MKPTHIHTPRTMDEGHFTYGYTTEPVGRKARSPWPRRLLMLAIASAVVIALTACGTTPFVQIK